jgi:hypothetical protein
MNRRQALEILGIREAEYTESGLKTEYRSKILQFHPDKNKSPDAAAKFIEIQTAYDFLKEGNSRYGPEPEDYRNKSYNDILTVFLSTIFREDIDGETIIAKIIELICKKICRILDTNSEHIIEYLRNINRDTLKKIHFVLSKYRRAFHFSTDLFEKIEEILREDECIVLNPTLDDLLSEENLYILKHRDRSFLVPLWQHELIFDISGESLVVKNYPILPDNMELDESNVLTVRLQFDLQELWGLEVSVDIGGKSFVIGGNMLTLTDTAQIVEYGGVGVPYNDSDNVLDATRKQPVVFMVTVSPP